MFPCGDFLYPLAAAEADGAPQCFDNLVGFERGINPERGNAKHWTRDYSERDCEYPQKDVVRKHKHFCVAAAAKNAFRHDAVYRMENDDEAY